MGRGVSRVPYRHFRGSREQHHKVYCSLHAYISIIWLFCDFFWPRSRLWVADDAFAVVTFTSWEQTFFILPLQSKTQTHFLKTEVKKAFLLNFKHKKHREKTNWVENTRSIEKVTSEGGWQKPGTATVTEVRYGGIHEETCASLVPFVCQSGHLWRCLWFWPSPCNVRRLWGTLSKSENGRDSIFESFCVSNWSPTATERLWCRAALEVPLYM